MSPAVSEQSPPSGGRKFTPPVISENGNGWGPVSLPIHFQDIPYQPFSKSDAVGKFAEWNGTGHAHERRQANNNNLFGAGGNAFTYFHDEDENSFSTVTDGIVKVPKYNKSRFQPQRRVPNKRYQIQNQAQNMQKLGRGQQKRRLGNAARTAHNRFSSFQQKREKRDHAASVEVQSDWQLIEEIQFGQLANLALVPEDAVDLKLCGQLEFYDSAYDIVRTKTSKPLQQVNRLLNNVTTSNDPVMKQISSDKNIDARVFITDSIMAAIMTLNRSIYSWDIVITREGDKAFFDKRASSNLNYLQVSETSPDPPSPVDDVKINTPDSLAVEATYINHNYSQQVLRQGPKVKFSHPNPFYEDDGSEMPSTAYKYRKWNIGGGVGLIVRCTVDAAFRDPTTKAIQMAHIKAINEYSLKGSNEWKQRLDIQPGAVFAAELKKNSCKFAKWATSAIVSGVDIIKVGYVVRSSPKDKKKHTIIGSQTYRPEEFASQINLNIHNSWGILRSLITLALDQPEGKYLLMKQPNNAIIHMYKIPEDALDSADEKSDEE